MLHSKQRCPPGRRRVAFAGLVDTQHRTTCLATRIVRSKFRPGIRRPRFCATRSGAGVFRSIRRSGSARLTLKRIAEWCGAFAGHQQNYSIMRQTVRQRSRCGHATRGCCHFQPHCFFAASQSRRTVISAVCPLTMPSASVRSSGLLPYCRRIFAIATAPSWCGIMPRAKSASASPE